MDEWLKPALDYIPGWLEYQIRESEQPGCVIAVVHGGRVVFERAFGRADIVGEATLTPRHRFRVASHSKSFTAAGVMKLREQRKLGLDDRAGQYVQGLHPAVAEATIAQLLSHSAGIIRDGTDSGQWQDARPFLDEAELRADLAAAPIIESNTRFKYSNHGYGLAGLVIEAVTREPYRHWIRREVIEPIGLDETDPDMPTRRFCAARAWPQREAATRPADRGPGEQPDQRAGAGNRFCQHGTGPRPLFRATRSCRNW